MKFGIGRMSQSEVLHIILNSCMVGGRRVKMRSEVVQIKVIQVPMPLTQSNHLLRAQVLYITKGRKKTNKTVKRPSKTWYKQKIEIKGRNT